MISYQKRLKELLKAFVDNQASEEEIREMFMLLQKENGDNPIQSIIAELRLESTGYEGDAQVDWDRIWNNIQELGIRPPAPVRKMSWWKVTAAAAVIMVIGGTFIWFGKNGQKNKQMTATAPKKTVINDVMPGGNKAVLTLANGAQIILDSAADGILAKQGSAEVVKTANGQLSYKMTGDQTAEVLFNTMSTPRGGLYRLILPDGSKVWLNAVSSIRYPTAFTGRERRVEITGEVYFEVEKNARMPFIVTVKNMEVSVLGTHFNINAYQDEQDMKTTLLEGSVKVSNGRSHIVIKPGQQTQLSGNGAIKLVEDADLSEAVAWKDGRFEFKETDIKTIMRQIMRWYDVEVEYQGKVPDRYFTADISRTKSLSGVLKILKLSDIDFQLAGKKLIVTP